MNLTSKSKLIIFSTLLLFLPGFNYYETLSLNPQGPKVKTSPIKLADLSLYPFSLGVPAPQLTASAAIVVDSDSAAILYQKNPDTKLLPASTTKIMTALVALDNYHLDEIVTVNQASKAIGHSMDLKRGEPITVENLLYGILVESGNDAAFALAQHFPSGYQGFIKAMNQKALSLNLTNTHFRNVSGVDQTGHVTTVRDLSILARYALTNPLFSKIVATKDITVKSTDLSIVHQLSNINQLLGQVPGILGVKTGWTENAGECLVSAVERQGHRLITVVLKSDDRFGETTKLIDWAYANHRWRQI